MNEFGKFIHTKWGSRSVSRVLYCRSSVYHSSRAACYHVLLSLPTLRLARATLKRRFTWNCSPQCARFTFLVSVAVTKHYCLTAVNRCGALCCPDFPLHAAIDRPAGSGVRESNPPPRLGKPMHYRCANTARNVRFDDLQGTFFIKKRAKVRLFLQICKFYCNFFVNFKKK